MVKHVLACSLMVALYAVPCDLNAAEFSAEQLAAAEARQAEDIDRLEAEIADLDDRKRELAKHGNREMVRNLIRQIKETKLELAKTKKATLDDYAAKIATEAHQKKEMADAAQARKKAEAKQRENDAERRKAEAVDEAERLQQSGGCPIKVVNGNFFHVNAEVARLGVYAKKFPSDVVGDSTIVVYRLENRASEDVEAYEILVQFLNGFDEVVASHSFQGLLLRAGERRETVKGVPEVKTAQQAKILVKRAKKVDGRVWERLPEHKNTGILIKIPEGPDKIGDGPG